LVICHSYVERLDRLNAETHIIIMTFKIWPNYDILYLHVVLLTSIVAVFWLWDLSHLCSLRLFNRSL